VIELINLIIKITEMLVKAANGLHVFFRFKPLVLNTGSLSIENPKSSIEHTVLLEMSVLMTYLMTGSFSKAMAAVGGQNQRVREDSLMISYVASEALLPLLTWLERDFVWHIADGYIQNQMFRTLIRRCFAALVTPRLSPSTTSIPVTLNNESEEIEPFLKVRLAEDSRDGSISAYEHAAYHAYLYHNSQVHLSRYGYVRAGLNRLRQVVVERGGVTEPQLLQQVQTVRAIFVSLYGEFNPDELKSEVKD
jgi:hypothetical protein